MTTREEVNAKLKELFDKNKSLTEEHKARMTQKAHSIFESMRQRTAIETKFINTEFSRYKITRLRNNNIIIDELKEDEAKSLYDKICQLT